MNIYYELESLKVRISRQTYKTILGQINAGDTEGALRGIERLKKDENIKN